MSKNLKNLIDQAEDEEKTYAQLEKKVVSLELKIAKLETKLKEKKESSIPKLIKSKKENLESEEINILKDIVSSQKQELEQKQQENEGLQQNIDNYEQELKNFEDSLNDSVKDEIIVKTQNSLNNLIEDYGRLENTIKDLKDEISKIEENFSPLFTLYAFRSKSGGAHSSSQNEFDKAVTSLGFKKTQTNFLLVYRRLINKIINFFETL